ncbi:MAG: hypothetical protein QGH40_01330 [bacterium]|nr:hypothetical protein [bacterium]
MPAIEGYGTGIPSSVQVTNSDNPQATEMANATAQASPELPTTEDLNVGKSDLTLEGIGAGIDASA